MGRTVRAEARHTAHHLTPRLWVRCIFVPLSFKAKHTCKTHSRTPNPNNPDNLGYHIYKTRLSRNLTQPKVAKIIGVDANTLSSWERGYREVSVRCMPKVFEFLGYNPLIPEATSLGGRFRKLRLEQGLTIPEIMKIAGMDAITIHRIESDDTRLQKRTIKKAEALLANQLVFC